FNARAFLLCRARRVHFDDPFLKYLPLAPTKHAGQSTRWGSVRHFLSVQAIVSNRNIYKITADGASEFPGLPYTPQGGHAHGTRTRKGKADQSCTPTKVQHS